METFRNFSSNDVLKNFLVSRDSLVGVCIMRTILRKLNNFNLNLIFLLFSLGFVSEKGQWQKVCRRRIWNFWMFFFKIFACVTTFMHINSFFNYFYRLTNEHLMWKYKKIQTKESTRIIFHIHIIVNVYRGKNFERNQTRICELELDSHRNWATRDVWWRETSTIRRRGSKLEK